MSEYEYGANGVPPELKSPDEIVEVASKKQDSPAPSYEHDKIDDPCSEVLSSASSIALILNSVWVVKKSVMVCPHWNDEAFENVVEF